MIIFRKKKFIYYILRAPSFNTLGHASGGHRATFFRVLTKTALTLRCLYRNLAPTGDRRKVTLVMTTVN